jgi:hypothetical protein
VVNDCSKSRRKGGQVGVEKMSESKPSDDASKGLAAVKTAGAVFLREESEGCSADRSDDSRCKGGMISTQALLRNARKADRRCVEKRQGANTPEKEYRGVCQWRSSRWE